MLNQVAGKVVSGWTPAHTGLLLKRMGKQGSSEMRDIHISPLIPQVFSHDTTVAVIRGFLAAQETAMME